jgi:pimeloyl-ACP methyl ester carboxylesterase
MPTATDNALSAPWTRRRVTTVLAVVLAVLIPRSGQGQEALPRLEPVECFAEIRGWADDLGVECAWLLVPQLRGRPSGATVRLPVARLRAREPDGSPPLVYLHGGPGGAGALLGAARSVFEWPIARRRDVIVYDQRGAGLSQPRLCPEVAREIDRRRDDPDDHGRQRWNGNARECLASLRRDGIEPLAYTTESNVLDLIDLRRSLGYPLWDVYGVSYGGTLAQEAMRRDGGAVRAAVLAYSSAPGPVMQAEAALSYQRSLERLFAACAEQPSCRTAFPALADDFFAVHDELQATPAEVTVESAAGATTRRVDGRRYLQEMRCQLMSPRTLRRIPLLVHELRRGDRARALEVLAGGCGAAGFNATLPLVLCHAIHGDAYQAAAAEVRRRVRPELRFLIGDNAECELWQERFADATAHELVRSDVPTLLLTGEFDERAPTALSRRIAASLTRAWLFELPGESHGGSVTGCHARILFGFLENPEQEPDASCIAEMPRVTFETGTLTLPTLVLQIALGSTAAERGAAEGPPLIGRWEAEIPNARQVVFFDLVLEGSTVSGTLRPQDIEIAGGRFTGGQIHFSFKSPDGLGVITLLGELRGDEIEFTREIVAPPGASNADPSIFGADGVRSFRARRAK